MSSTSKGNAFEGRSYDALKKELESDRLCVSAKAARIFRSRAYHSRDRDDDIFTDISIEVTLAGKEKPSLIWIFECKDYSGTIPVNDLEEFHAKIQQVGEDNTKGTIVTSGALQKGALKYAKAKGIGVVRLLPDDQVEHVMELLTIDSLARSRFDSSEVVQAITNANHRSRNGFFAICGDYVYGNWTSLLDNELQPYADRGT